MGDVNRDAHLHVKLVSEPQLKGDRWQGEIKLSVTLRDAHEKGGHTVVDRPRSVGCCVCSAKCHTRFQQRTSNVLKICVDR